MAAARDDISPYRERCHDTDERGRAACVLGAPGKPATAVIWGDSHAVEFAYVLSRMLAARGEALIEHSHSSCPPLIGYEAPGDAQCARNNRAVLTGIEADPKLGTVYLAAFWESPAYASAQDMEELDQTIAELIKRGRHVVLIGPVPPNKFDVPRHLARLARFGSLDTAIGRDRADLQAVETRINAVAARWAPHGLTYIDPIARLCDAQSCAILRDGVPLYYDHHHPSVAGASLILGERRQLASLSR
jgi:hypothetical protein